MTLMPAAGRLASIHFACSRIAVAAVALACATSGVAEMNRSGTLLGPSVTMNAATATPGAALTFGITDGGTGALGSSVAFATTAVASDDGARDYLAGSTIYDNGSAYTFGAHSIENLSYDDSTTMSAEITPVPEAPTWIAAILSLVAAGWSQRRVRLPGFRRGLRTT